MTGLTALKSEATRRAAGAERALIAGCLNNPNEFLGARDVVSRTSFADAFHGEVWDAMGAQFEEHGTIDVVHLRGQLPVDFADRVMSLVDLGEVALRVPVHAQSVARAARQRSAATSLRESIAALWAADDAHVEDVIAGAVDRIAAVRDGDDTVDTVKDLGQTLHESMELLEDQMRGNNGISTGFRRLDKKTFHLRRQEVSLVAARTSMGKTTFALNLAKNLLKADVGVLFFTLEQPAARLGLSLLASHSSVDEAAIRARTEARPGDARRQANRLIKAHDDLLQSGWRIFFEDRYAQTPSSIRAIARRYRRKHNVGCVIVDYLQIVDPDPDSRSKPRHQQLAEASRAMKQMARELDVPVVLCCQLNRVSETEGNRPRMRHIKDSGSIEQDADQILLLHRPEYYFDDETAQAEKDQWRGVTRVFIDKNRYGPPGDVSLQFNGATHTFRDLPDRKEF